MSALALKTTAVVGGVTFLGWVIMKTTSPSKEEMMKRLPPDMVTEKKLKEIQAQNEAIFASLKRTMNSNDPVWKLKEAEAVHGRKQ